MHIAECRVRAEIGLIPAGRYFRQLARNLGPEPARGVSRSADDGAVQTFDRRASIAVAPTEPPPM